jgi:hypothetical protein
MKLSLPLGTSDVELVLADDEDPLASLVVEVDLDYDGVVDATSAGDAALTLQLDELGERVMRLRVVDPSGRSGSALLSVNVTDEEPEPEPEPEPTFDPSFYPAGAGCGLASGSSGLPPLGFVALAFAAALGGTRRRRAR